MAITSHGQKLLPGQFIEQRFPTFHPDSIKAYGIQSITIRMMDKPSNEPMYDRGRRFSYFFDKKGRLIRQQKLFPGWAGRVDTASLTWMYKNGALVAQLEHLGSYRRMVHYEKIDAGLIKQTISVKRGSLDWQTLAEEQIETIVIDSGEIIRLGGLDAKPYQSTTIKKNANGTMTSREVWTGGKLQTKETWQFTRETLDAYVFEDGSKEESWVVHFNGNSESGTWCHNLECRDWSIVFNPNGWPKGWILMNPETQDMEIWEFEYSYFPR